MSDKDHLLAQEQQEQHAHMLDRAWAGLANVAERAVARISASSLGGHFPHHVSVIVRHSPPATVSSSGGRKGALRIKVYDGSRQWSGGLGIGSSDDVLVVPVTISTLGGAVCRGAAADGGLLLWPQGVTVSTGSSIVEKCLRVGGSHQTSNASIGALSLYWCQGLGALHHQISKNVNRMDQLEKLVKRQQLSSQSSSSEGATQLKR